MNEEMNIENQLQIELHRLKKAIQYIEQAENTVQKAKLLNDDYQSKYASVLKSNEELKSFLNVSIHELENKLEKINEELSAISAHVMLQKKMNHQNEQTILNIQSEISKFNSRLDRNKQEIEEIKQTKWYKRFLGIK